MPATPASSGLLTDAKAHAAAGRRAEAADAYEAAAAAAPRDVEVQMTAAGAAFAAGRFERAVELFERVTRLTPNHARALVNIGAIHNRTGDHRQAERILQKAVQLDHNIAEGFYNLGIARRKLNRNKLAADAYREAIRLDPSFAEAHQNLGNTLLDLGRSRAAANAFREALRIRPDFPKASAGLKRADADAAEKKASLKSMDRFSIPPVTGSTAGLSSALTRKFPPLTANRRAQDRTQLTALTADVEHAAAEWVEMLRGDLPGALAKLEHSIAGSTGTRLSDAFDDLESAVTRAEDFCGAFRAAMIRMRAHEELIRTPKLAAHSADAPPVDEPPSSASSPALMTTE